jgi:membrane peptidoglycan carboxypeptidase
MLGRQFNSEHLALNQKSTVIDKIKWQLNMFKKIKYCIFIFLAIVIVYYVVVIIVARRNTKEIVYNELKSDRIHLELDNLSKEQLSAIIKIQDPNFYQHHGVDIFSQGHGLTTISQSLVKAYYFKDFTPGIVNKIKQTLIAYFAFDPLTPKDTILKLFINQVYLGENSGFPIHGLLSGAKYYFQKDFNQLNWDEFLQILAMFDAPNIYNIKNNPSVNWERVLQFKKMLSMMTAENNLLTNVSANLGQTNSERAVARTHNKRINATLFSRFIFIFL